jgi:hypothetical protein
MSCMWISISSSSSPTGMLSPFRFCYCWYSLDIASSVFKCLWNVMSCSRICEIIVIFCNRIWSRLFTYSSTSEPGLSTSFSKTISCFTRSTTSSMCFLWPLISSSSSSRIYSIIFSWSLQSISVSLAYSLSNSS